MTTLLEQSLQEDIKASEAELNPKPAEKAAEVVADEVIEKVKETEVKEAEAEVVAQQDEEETLPENPTKEDFARQRIKAREEKKKLEEELRKEREEKARQAGYIAAKNETPPVAKQEQAKVVEEPEPDIEENPREWKEWFKRQTQAEIKSVRQNYQELKVTSAIKDSVANAKQEEANYAKENPTYSEAKAYLDEVALNNLKARNPVADKEQLKAQLLQDEYAAILNAKQLGFHPAIYFEMLAKQAGFKPKPPTLVNADTNKIVEKKANISAIQRNKDKSPTLAGTRSNAGSMGEPTDEEIADLTLAQLAAIK